MRNMLFNFKKNGRENYIGRGKTFFTVCRFSITGKFLMPVKNPCFQTHALSNCTINIYKISEGITFFQQNGATCHTTDETIQLLQAQFNDLIISRRDDVIWLPISCNLTPSNFFRWVYHNDKVCISILQTNEDLKKEIRRDTDDISNHLG